MQEMEEPQIWDELIDYENMADERQLEPDYFIDRPSVPIFIPNPEGEIKAV